MRQACLRFFSLVVVTSLIVSLLLAVVRPPSSRAGPPCSSEVHLFSADCNNDGTLNVSDPICLLEYLFGMGPAPLCLADGANFLDDTYVNELQPDSVTSEMVVDEELQQNDLAFTAVDLSSDQTITSPKELEGRVTVEDGKIIFDQVGVTGSIEILGPHSRNVLLSQGFLPNEGCIAVFDENGAWRAGMYFIQTGFTEVFADAKLFQVPNPDPEQPNTEIWYACLEGPEAAAYIRGTATLVEGRAEVSFPKHFRTVASEIGMTVELTPLSAESRGLSIRRRSVAGIAVEELQAGRGSYEFDYFVMALRKGHEDFRVIRRADEMQFARSVDKLPRPSSPSPAAEPLPRADRGRKEARGG